MTDADTDDILKRLVERVDELERELDRRPTLREHAELEREVESLHDERTDGTARYLAGMLASQLADVENVDYGAHADEYREAFGKIGAMIQRHESVIDEHDAPSRDPMEANWKNVVEKARNLEDSPENAVPGGKVKLFANDVQGATGHSRRHCLDLIEKLGDEKPGATWREYEPPSPEANNKAVPKALVVDLGVWGEE